jgi:hypothetical protein
MVRPSVCLCTWYREFFHAAGRIAYGTVIQSEQCKVRPILRSYWFFDYLNSSKSRLLTEVKRSPPLQPARSEGELLENLHVVHFISGIRAQEYPR